MDNNENKDNKHEKFFEDQVKAATLARELSDESDINSLNWDALQFSMQYYSLRETSSWQAEDVIKTAKLFKKFLQK